MGPNERAAWERRAAQLRRCANLSPWSARELDEIEARLRRQDYIDNFLGRTKTQSSQGSGQ